MYYYLHLITDATISMLGCPISDAMFFLFHTTFETFMNSRLDSYLTMMHNGPPHLFLIKMRTFPPLN